METTSVDLSVMLVLGLVSSLHCVGMCGPIIAVSTAPLSAEASENRRSWLRLLAWQGQYNLGRGVTYVLLGVLLSLAGSAIGALFPAKAVGSVIQIAVGLLLVVLTLWAMLRGRAVKAPAKGTWLGKLLGGVITSRRGASVLLLGLLTGFLPCGVLYAAFARSLAASSPLEGGALMFAFWAGTVPLLIGFGLTTGSVLRLVGRRTAAVLVAVAMLSTGGWMVYKGVNGISGTAGTGHGEGCCQHAHG